MRNRGKLKSQNAERARRPRPCPDCGDVHRRDEECEIDWEDEAAGLGAFIGSLMAGLSAFAERQRQQRQQPAPQRIAERSEPEVIEAEYEVIEEKK